MRVAAIDVGTSTVLCTIADLEREGPDVVLEHAAITRLGEGVDRSGTLAPRAVERTLAELANIGSLVRAHGVKKTFAVGTSALRDAKGGAELVGDATRVLGCELRVLDGADEARLTFGGATWQLPVEGAVCVVDIGGGSTEIVEGTISGDASGITSAVSLDIGSVRLFERFVTSDPPTAHELARVRDTVRCLLAGLPAPRAGAVIGVAGTVTTLVALAGVSGAPHGSELDLSDVERLEQSLAEATLAERRSLGGLEPGRADVIPIGALILGEILRWRGVEGLIASDRGVRWGLLRDAALALR